MTTQGSNSSSPRCIVCNRVLTDPNFVLLQMGPTCAKKYNKSPTRYDRSLVAATNTDLGLQRVALTPETLNLAMTGQLEKAVEKDPEKYEKVYLNDRKSKVAQLGEDVRGAARHKSLVWSSLKEAEELGMAEQLINRDNLLKKFDKSKIKDLAETDYEKAVILSTYLKKLPKCPEAVSNARYGTFQYEKAENALEEGKPYAIGYELDEQAGKFNRLELNYKGIHWDDIKPPKKGFTKEEYLQMRRKFFYDNYEFAQNLVNEMMNSDDILTIDNKKLLRRLSDRTREFVRGNNYGHMGYHNGAFTKWFNSSIASRSTQSIVGAVQEYRSLGIPGDSNHIEEYLEGKSLRASFGRKKAVKGGSRKKEIKLSDFYGKEAERIGPEVKEQTQKELEKALVGEIGLRGFQYGRSLPDNERMEHLKHMIESVDDLCDVLGIERKDFSLDKTLAIAVGARGKSSAMAHYEPRDKIINITRKNGVGSLCHEWMHGLDHHIGSKEGGNRYLSERSGARTPSKKVLAYEEFHKSLEPFLKRMTSSDTYRSLSTKKKGYFSSRKEIFARVGEKMIDYKLRKKKRLNTYLSGVQNETFYPNDEEMSQGIEGAFDRLMDAIFEREDRDSYSSSDSVSLAS